MYHPLAAEAAPHTCAVLTLGTVEWLRRATAAMARAQLGHSSWLLLHFRERRIVGGIRTRSSGTGEHLFRAATSYRN